MRTIIYVGQSVGVNISATGQYATRDEPIEVESDLADSLLEQSVWEEAKQKPRAVQPAANDERE